ncbi:MAG: cyclic nucleotide-binding domain-containing protein [Verrucomicrobiota bacterium]
MHPSILASALESITKLECKRFSQGDAILEEGSENYGLYFLESGDIEVVKDGSRVSLIHERGSVFGEISILLETVPTATVRALTSAKLFYTDRPCEFLKANPSVHLFVSCLLAERLRAVTSYLVNVKQQFCDNQDHTSMIDSVLDGLTHKQTWDQ